MTTLTHIKHHIPKYIGWLIFLKGMVNLIFGISSFFWSSNVAALNDLSTLVLFWDFNPVKSLTAILIGVIYLFLGRGLYHGRHAAWRLALLFSVLNLLDSLLPHLILFQFIYGLFMMLILWLFRASFHKPSTNPMRPQQVIAFFSVVVVLVYGVVGCYLLRAQYQGIHTFVDAFYYSMETYSTIGYGDILPITSNAKIFTCSMIILGVGTFIAAISILLGPAMEQRMKKVVTMVNKLNASNNHVIVVGGGVLSLHIAKTLQAKGKSVLVIAQDTDQLKLAEKASFKVISGDPSHEDVLQSANLKDAHTLICASNSDAQNLLVTMVAERIKKNTHAHFKIITRIDEPQNIDYATQSGADKVISPTLVLGEIVAQAVP